MQPPTHLSLMTAPDSEALEDHGTRGRRSTNVSFLILFFFFGVEKGVDKLLLNIITPFTVEFEIQILTFKSEMEDIIKR